MGGFIIRHNDLVLEVGLTDINSLKLHEQTLNQPLKTLVRDIVQKGMMKHPIIIDANTLTVLDGTHRIKALKEIGCMRALTCYIDYKNPKVQVKFWYRTLDNIEVNKAQKIIDEMKIPVQNKEFNRKKLSSRTLIFALVTMDRLRVFEKNRSSEEAYDIVRVLEKKLMNIGKISYHIEDVALDKALKGEVNATLAIPRLYKNDIIKLADKGYLLPPKTTRHIIPARPLGVNAPLDLLMNKRLTIEEANSVLIESLKRRPIQRLGPRVSYENRFYEEELYIFQ